MRASEFITESLLSKGAEFLIQLLKGGKKSTPKPVTVDQRIVYNYRVTNFGGKRLYATPQQAENLDSLAKSAADIRAMIQRLESRGGGTTVWRNDLKEVEGAIEQLMKEISKNKKMDVSPHSLESLDESIVGKTLSQLYRLLKKAEPDSPEFKDISNEIKHRENLMFIRDTKHQLKKLNPSYSDEEINKIMSDLLKKDIKEELM
jgi:hypothetical protein